MSKDKTAILIMNVGSPDAPTKQKVRKYLKEFLNDKRVIDLPWIVRKILVNLIIIPFRVKKSTGLYQKLWTEKGSPLIYLTEDLRERLQLKLGDGFRVFTGMRYGNPGYRKALAEIKKEGFKKLVVAPLYPQHALSTTESSFVAIEKEIKKINPELEYVKIGQFYTNPGFIRAFASQGRKNKIASFDHVLFSFHGLPIRQDSKSKPEGYPGYSFRGACVETARLIARELNLAPDHYSVAFQSRLSKNWLGPFSDELIHKKLSEGNKNILVFAPSFVTDCLETIVEISLDYRSEFLKKGGQNLQLVESLNTCDEWIEELKRMILNQIEQVWQQY